MLVALKLSDCLTEGSSPAKASNFVAEEVHSLMKTEMEKDLIPHFLMDGDLTMKMRKN